MTTGNRSFLLPGKVDAYLATLNRHYRQQGEALLREVVVNGTVLIDEARDYDNWNGGRYGHAIALTVTEELYLRIVDEKDDIRRRIAADINKLNSSQDEYVSEVLIEMRTTDDDNWREATGIHRPHAAAPAISPEALSRIWGEGRIGVFLSHKSTVKENTSRIKQSLARCGVAAFVAHEDIEPTEEWQREIERALFSMDALVALLSDDYHDSNWTDQEVGVAIGRGVPVIAVRLGTDPYGLMGKGQGLGGCRWEYPDGIAVEVFQLLHKRLPDRSRLFECALSAYAASVSFVDSAWKVEHLLSNFDALTEDQVQRVLKAHRENGQNNNSINGRRLLTRLLEKWTGKTWNGAGRDLAPEAQENEDPF